MPSGEVTPIRPITSGQVASLHLHPAEPGTAMVAVDEFTLVEDKGIKEDVRYFDRPSRRKVSLIEREQLAEHAGLLGVESVAPGAARSNLETTGIRLADWIGCDVQIGEAVLHLYAPRTPCPKMDAVAPGLRELMENGCLGVLATVIRSGRMRVGDSLTPVDR